MDYSDFNLKEIIDNFGLVIQELSGLFANLEEQESSYVLSTILQ